YMQGLEFPYTF
nr:immunoglobulin light chain junction region [Macaca mulatta]